MKTLTVFKLESFVGDDGKGVGGRYTIYDADDANAPGVVRELDPDQTVLAIGGLMHLCRTIGEFTVEREMQKNAGQSEVA